RSHAVGSATGGWPGAVWRCSRSRRASTATAAPTVGLSWLVPSSSSSGVPPPLRELEEDLFSLDRDGTGGFGLRSRLLSHLRSLCDRLFPGSWPPDGGCSSWQKAQLGSVTPRPTCHLR